jgi:hypothetical protein
MAMFIPLVNWVTKHDRITFFSKGGDGVISMKRFAAFALLCAVGCGGDTKSTPVKDLNKQLPPAPMGAGGKKSNSPAMSEK